MKKTCFTCDACKKESATIVTAKLPIKVMYREHWFLELADVDLCQACANKISNAYYDIAREYGCSGKLGIKLAEEDL